jgi:hypothetical protein
MSEQDDALMGYSGVTYQPLRISSALALWECSRCYALVGPDALARHATLHASTNVQRHCGVCDRDVPVGAEHTLVCPGRSVAPESSGGS